MKKIILTAAALLAFAGFGFAQESNTNRVTQGLIDDELVDKLDTGSEEGDEGEEIQFLFFGGYDVSGNRAEIGAGKQFGSLWFSVYDAYRFSANETDSETAKADTVALDGVNTDYTDGYNTASVTGSSVLSNELRFATFFNHKWGLQFVWDADWNSYNSGSGTNPTASLSTFGTTTATTTKDSSEDHAAGTTTNTEYDTYENRVRNNSFVFNFNNVALSGITEKNIYLQLNSIGVSLADTYKNIEYSTTNTLNGSRIGAGTQTSYSGEYDNFNIMPKIEVEFGLDVAKPFDLVDMKFALIEEFAPTFKSYTDTYDYTYWSETTTTKTTTTTSYEGTDDDYFAWSNIITPRFDFEFTEIEDLTLKARIDLPVTLSGISYSAKEYTSTARIATYDKTTNQTTYTTTTTSGVLGTGYDYDSFTTEVDPTFSLGLVYAVKPGKLNINVGTTLSSGTLSWTSTESTYSGKGRTTKTTSTNAAGETTTTSVSYTPSNGDTAASGESSSITADRKSNSFTSGTPRAAIAVGATWFLSDHVQLDTTLLAGNYTSTANSSGWAFNIQFGFKY